MATATTLLEKCRKNLRLTTGSYSFPAIMRGLIEFTIPVFFITVNVTYGDPNKSYVAIKFTVVSCNIFVP